MTAPVTGPFTRDWYLLGPPNVYGFAPVHWRLHQTWHRQKQPYDQPLGYVMEKKRVVGFSSWNPAEYASTDTDPPFYDGTTTAAATNKAYAKFVSEFGEQSQWFVTLYQQKQTVALLADPLSKLLKFTKLVKKGKFEAAARLLKTGVPKGLRNTAKSFGNNWLKYHFGIEPLVKDIGAAMTSLTRDFDPIKIVGRGTDGNIQYVPVNTVVGIPGGNQRLQGEWKQTTITKVRIRAEFKINNPNLFLANNMGFVNPASIIWELIPFSFIVDWFTNVGQILASFTDFAGVSLLNPSTTIYQKSLYSHTYVYTNETWTFVNQGPGVPPLYLKKTELFLRQKSLEYVRVHRSLSIAGPTLHIPAFKGLSVTRGVTAIALLVQQLKT
jgi:hypothetical protein